jgi:biopolymer transport protein ExbD
MAQIDTGGGGGHGKHDKKRAKKLSTRIDMTPMVDLAFLLLTFFVLTSTFSKPKVLRMIFPEKKNNIQPKDLPKVKDGLTLIINGTDKVYYYSGSTDKATALEVTDFSKDGLRKILKDRNKWLINQIEKIQIESDKGPRNDTAFERKIKMKMDKAQGDSKFVVLVKHTGDATYKNMIDVVDEFLITQVGKYFVVDEPLGKKEQMLLDKKLKE